MLCVGRTATLDRLVQRSSIALALYVSHHPRNFQMLRFPSVAHVYLGHGESDKAVSASNQLKAYDRVFVAGPAAEERVQTGLMWFDASRMVRIGRPQATAPDPRPAPDRPTVLYAPTWEEPSPPWPTARCSRTVAHWSSRSWRLGCASSTGRTRARANRRDVAAADAALRALFATDDMRNGGHTVDTDEPLTGAFAGADLLITDVSSLAVEWLPTGRPLIVTVPRSRAPSSPPPRCWTWCRGFRPTRRGGRASWPCGVWSTIRNGTGAGPSWSTISVATIRPARSSASSTRATTSSPHGTPRSPVPARPRELRTTGLAEHPTAPAGHSAAGDPRPSVGRALDRRPLHAAHLAVPHPAADPGRPDGERGHRPDDRHRCGVGLRLLIPGLWGAVLAVLLTQQMLWDASDGEVARWRGTSSPLGIFLDRVGHYLTESLIPIGLGPRRGRLRRAAGGIRLDDARRPARRGDHPQQVAERHGPRVPRRRRVEAGCPTTRRRRGRARSALARLRRLARFVPFHRLYHSIELSLLVLVAALVDLGTGDLTGTRVLLVVLVPASLLAVAGHFLAIVSSARLRPSAVLPDTLHPPAVPLATH